MKFHALTLCLAGTLVAGIAAKADHTADHKVRSSHESTYIRTGAYRGPMDATFRFHQDEYWARVLEHENIRREVLYPDLPSSREVAEKVSRVIEKQRTEEIALCSMAPKAQTAGFTNITTVYEYMANDHDRLADWASNWCAERGFSVPSTPTEVPVADMTPEASIDHHVQMHIDSFNQALEARKTEKSSTVRGLLLWSASMAAHHISVLRTLDRDVDLGRKTVSARLKWQMDTAGMPADYERVVVEILEEETLVLRGDLPRRTGPDYQVIEQVVEVERIVEKPVVVEKIVEKPVERIVEKPVYIERVVEKPVYIERPAARTRVLGRRQSTPRARRPAK